MFIKTYMIADHELGLLFRDRRFKRLLGPGSHVIAGLTSMVEVRIVNLRDMPVGEPSLKALYATHRTVVDEHFAVADMGDAEIGFVFADGGLVDVVGPGQIAFYGKRLYDIRIDVVDASQAIDVPPTLIAPLARLKASGVTVDASVPSGHVGLLYVDGVLTRKLQPGRYAFLKAVRQVTVTVLDLRLTTLEVTGQEVLTRDRIGVRANLTAVYRIADPEKAVEATVDLKDHLYKALQFALREVIGQRTLDEVLGDKQGINAALAERTVPGLGDVGLAVATVGVKDIVLPGDVRELMNRVIDAEKTAQANVIKRREETAATRSLLNTAKLMEDNPTLLRLKELEALEKVAEKVGNVIVGNGMDGVLNDLVRIKPRPQEGK
jgi:regulator of protease activity HflC (stomatin/prohibitin superfamily)